MKPDRKEGKKSSYREIIKSFAKMGISFRAEVSENFISIKSDAGNFGYSLGGEKMSLKQLNLYLEFKRGITALLDLGYGNEYKGLRLNELQFSFGKYNHKTKYFRNGIYTDLNGAYWTSAKNLGFVTDDLYKRLMNKENKLIRNRFIGTLQMRKEIFEYTKSKGLQSSGLSEAIAPHYYMGIVSNVENLIRQGYLDFYDDFNFFYSDAIFFSSGLDVPKYSKLVLDQGFSASFDEVILGEGVRSSYLLHFDKGGIVAETKKYNVRSVWN